MMKRYATHFKLVNGQPVSRLGQGTWFIGDDPARYHQEVTALQLGIDLGLNLIDTAEMYGNGASERVVADAITGHRDQVFLVSKVLPYHADKRGTLQACEASLRRLKTDFLDLYLLHWRGDIPLEETILGMEQLVNQGKIRHWGISNFDLPDMQELYSLTDDPRQVLCNQVLYNLSRRGVEFDLLPYSQTRDLSIMAYSPIEQGRILQHPALSLIAKALNVTPAQVALAWVLRQSGMLAIPKAVTHQHVMDNAHALTLNLSSEHFEQLNRAFPAPQKKVPLQML